jgi:hypothetical protein
MNIKPFYYVIFTTVFTLTQFFFAIDGMGLEGKGTAILAAPFRLFGLTWLLLICAVYFTFRRNDAGSSSLFLVCLGLHYLITFWHVGSELYELTLSSSTELGLGRVLVRRPQVLWFGALTYLAGNVIIWWLYLKDRTDKVTP